jgi:hypothetical protein
MVQSGGRPLGAAADQDPVDLSHKQHLEMLSPKMHQYFCDIRKQAIRETVIVI